MLNENLHIIDKINALVNKEFEKDQDKVKFLESFAIAVLSTNFKFMRKVLPDHKFQARKNHLIKFLKENI